MPTSHYHDTAKEHTWILTGRNPCLAPVSRPHTIRSHTTVSSQPFHLITSKAWLSIFSKFNKSQMAVLDNFEVTVLTIDRSTLDRRRASTGPRWVEVEECDPPGSDDQQSSFNQCRRYIGVPPSQVLESVDRVSTEFVIDYKVRCGFEFPDQCDTGVEYIVFRTYLDGEKVGAASVNRKRWERSGTYRQRKQGKRYRVEGQYRWIRQRWMFDPGLHGTIKVEVWRERTRIPVMNDWGLIGLTGEDDLVVGQRDLSEIAHEPNAKRPRVKNTVKVDLLPLATFEFEYRSEDTLRLLGLREAEATDKIETGVQPSSQQPASDYIVIDDDNDLWRTLTSTSSSGDTFDTSMDRFSDDTSPFSHHRRFSCGDTPRQDLLPQPMIYTDAIGRSLLTGLSPTEPTISPINLSASLMHGSGYENAIPILEDGWWAECNASIKAEETPRYGKTDLVDLTMLD